MLSAREIESYPVKEGIVIWSLGGPSLVIRTRELLLYLDLFTGPSPVADLEKAIPEVIDPAAIRKVDMALSTHNHEDHCNKYSLGWLYKNTSSLFVGPVSCNRLYRDWGFDLARTRLIAPYESFIKGDVTVHGLPSKDDLEPDAVCFLLEVGSVKIFDGGDTFYFPEMAKIGRTWKIDIAFLSYAKNPPEHVAYMDEEAVLKGAQALNAKILILKHYDLWVESTIDPMPLLECLRARGHDARVLGLGERFEYGGQP